MANIKEPAEMQTPNTVNTEVQETVQANKVVVQPEPENYATSGMAKESITKPVQTPQTQETVQTVTQPEVITQAQTVQPIQNQSNVAIRIPSDLYDQTVQGYLDEFKKGQEINDYQAQINALNAIDQYRTAQGYKPIYTANVYELTNQRIQKIKNQIRDYEIDMATAINSGNEALAQQIGQQMEAYKKAVNYGETVNNSATYLQNIEYKSTYDSVISGIVNELLTTRFTYDPSDDEALLKAQQYATNSIYESMNAKGILDSTMTAQIVAKTANELVPIYEKMAKEDFYNNLERLQSMANFVMNLEETQYSRWLTQVQVKLDYYEAQKDEIAYQWDRVNQLGYVDNEASIILGVAPGTMSPSMREAIEEAERQANEQYNKLYSDLILAEAKEAISNGYKVVQNDGSINVQSYMLRDNSSTSKKTTSDGNNVGDSGSEIYGSDWSYTDKKDAILAKVESGELGEAGAVKEIYANFDGNEIPKALKAILGKTEKQAKALLDEELITEIVTGLKSEAGEITEDNIAVFDAYVNNAYKNGTYTKEFAEDILAEVDAELMYNQLLTHYIDTINENINFVKNAKKSHVKKVAISKQVERIEKNKEELIEKIGAERYNTLLQKVQTAEENLSSAFDEKGLDW